MADPIPYVVEADGTVANAPGGAIPIALYGVPSKADLSSVATVATADATDLATAIVLVNALKSRLNALITALKA
jgi:hypothetical protein